MSASDVKTHLAESYFGPYIEFGFHDAMIVVHGDRGTLVQMEVSMPHQLYISKARGIVEKRGELWVMPIATSQWVLLDKKALDSLEIEADARKNDAAVASDETSDVLDAIEQLIVTMASGKDFVNTIDLIDSIKDMADSIKAGRKSDSMPVDA